MLASDSDYGKGVEDVREYHKKSLRDLVREGFLIIEERQRESGADSSNNYRLLSA